jgi:uncharacterized protein YbjT (DUF2867 family)
MRIVVAGSTGNTGAAVVRELAKAGHEVVALTRDVEGKVGKALASLPGVEVTLREHAFDKPVDRYLTDESGPYLF